VKRVAVMTTLTSRNVRSFQSPSVIFSHVSCNMCASLLSFPMTRAGRAGSARAGRQLAVVVDLSIEEFRRSGEVPFGPFRGAAAQPPADGAPVCGCGSRGSLFVDVDGTLAPCSTFAPSTFGRKPKPMRRVLSALEVFT